MFHGETNPGADTGFIDIGTAEVRRQSSAVSVFRAKHGAEYDRLVNAVTHVKLAHQELEAAKAACASAPVGTPIGDLLDSAEREVRAKLQQAAEEATLAQLEQIGNAGAAPKAKKAS
jgi:hypothetical protein